MTVVAVTMVKNEADMIGTTIRHLLAEGVDRIIVADNNSTDGTRGILDLVPEVLVIVDPEPGYWQSRKISALAEDARCLGADWVVPFDADEIWYSPHGRLADVLDLCPEKVATAITYEHPPLLNEPLPPYRARQPNRLRKVAFRASRHVTVAQGNHNVSIRGPRAAGLLEIREFQYRTFSQFVRKVRQGKTAYDATDLPASEGAHWRHYGAMTDDELADEWATMLARTDVIYDPAPIRS